MLGRKKYGQYRPTEVTKYEVDPIQILQKIVKTILKDQQELRTELAVVSKREQTLAIQYKKLIQDYEILRDEVTDLMYPPGEIYDSKESEVHDDHQDGWGDDYFEKGDPDDNSDGGDGKDYQLHEFDTPPVH